MSDKQSSDQSSNSQPHVHPEPPRPAKSVRITLDLPRSEKRLDTVLLLEIRKQKNLNLREITRMQYKELFNTGRIQIKGQNARPSSALAKGITYVDILGY